MAQNCDNFFIDAVERGFYISAYKYNLPFLCKFLGYFDLWVYMRLFFIIFKGYLYAVRHKFTEEIWRKYAFEVIRLFENCGCRFEFKGLEYIKEIISINSPVVIVANHMSFLETFLLPCFFPHPLKVHPVVKRSLLDYPLFGKILKYVDPIAVSRTNPRRDLEIILEQGLKFLNKGEWILVFPQSTRSHSFDRSRFNSIGVKLAKRAEGVILPIAVKTDNIGFGKFIKDFGHIERSKTVYFYFGKPEININASTHERILNFLAVTLDKLGVEVL